MANIQIMNATMPEPTRTQGDRTYYDLPAGTITRVNPPSETPEDYYIIINETEYQCNYFLDGDTKIRVAYRTNNHDTFSISLSKADSAVEMIVRLAEIEVATGDSIKLVCRTTPAEDLTIKKAIVRFNHTKAVMLTYDEVTDTVEMQEVE